MLGRTWHHLSLVPVVALLSAAPVRAESPPPSAKEKLLADAEAMTPLVSTDVARLFLRAVDALPDSIPPRVVWYDRSTREAMTGALAAGKSTEELEGFERREIDAEFYWNTRYGTPLAFVRPLDLLAEAGLTDLDGARIVDFGFGSIGQLRLLASVGTHAVGIEVDALLEAMYSRPADTGVVSRSPDAGAGADGDLRLVFGRFPAEERLVDEIGEGYDAFISKNTLKHGYIHPAEEVDPRMLVHLGVDDATFVAAVHDVLKDDGWFLIYNLHPAQSEERYIPWADGRSPFSRDVLEAGGFDVLAFDVDDTEAARRMGEALGWAELMDFEKDLFGTYTLCRKRGASE